MSSYLLELWFSYETIHNFVSYTLLSFSSFLCNYLSCISRLRVIAEFRHGDLFHSANIVSRYKITYKFKSHYLLMFPESHIYTFIALDFVIFTFIHAFI